MKITYYLEVTSSWCHWAEPAWANLKDLYAGRVVFDWKIALMRPSDFPVSAGQADWFYRRSGTIMRSPYMLNSGWFEDARKGHYEAPNLVAEAARELGIEGDSVRLALAHAGVREGLKTGDLDVSVKVAAMAGKLPPRKLKAAAQSKSVREKVDASSAEFHAHQITQRPAFILENDIGDKAVFSGLCRAAPLAAAIDAMLSDATGYASHFAHFGGPPKA